MINYNLIPPGLRCCYWAAEYVAAQPFCLSSKLTDKEAKDLADFEEMKFWERTDQLKKELNADILISIEETLEEIKQDRVIDIQKVVDLYFLAPKKFYFVGFAKSAKGVGMYNIQPSGRVLPKSKQQTQQLRVSFLTR